MEKKFKRIGVLTSGGDAPGMNAAVRAVTRAAIARGYEVVGIIGGYSGLLADPKENKLIPLTDRSVSNIITRGGTILYTDRCDEFKYPEGQAKAVKTCRDNDIDAVIAIGGDGTFRGAVDLTRHGIPTIGLPGTIDNDITTTDYTIGFDTAMNTVIECIDKLRDTCESHARCNVVEVMGRDCGEIALETAIATGAIACAIPEVPFDEKACLEKIKAAKESGKRGFIVVVSEGVFDEDGKPYGEGLKKRIQEATGVETKFARLAHVVRGGDPSLRDRTTASRMGVMAVDLLEAGKSNCVVLEKNGKLVALDIEFALATDNMRKKKLKEGALDKFTAEQVADMKAYVADFMKSVEERYAVLNELAR